jgi:serine/threonine protein kinase
MFRQNKTLVLIDFGFASDVYHQRFGRGTPGYMPPEYFKDDISGTWNDIFSAGAVFFKM